MSDEKKILLVDDEIDILEFISYNLDKEGYRVYTAQNGKDAIRIAEKKEPDLIILDVMMPEMDGIVTCEELRKIPKLKNTVIAFLTARSEDYSQIAGFEAGADDYITKPIRPKVLISRVKALLRRFSIDENASEKINVAGLVAEQIYTGKKNKTGAVGDFEEWINVTLLGLPNKLDSKYQNFLLDYTKEVLELEINWLHITSIAEALVERKTLNYSQVIDVFLQSSRMWKETKPESVRV